MKKFKGFKITAILTMMCVCIAYFSLLSPTTAYFYNSTSANEKINFDLFDVQQTLLTVNESFDFPGTTKFSDFNEPLFDKVVCQKTVTVTNKGDIPARVYVKLTDTTGVGLHYIPFYDYEAVTDSNASQTALTKGVLKQEIEDVLKAYNPNFVDGITQVAALEILNGYNETAYGVIQPGQSLDITIVFWVEYDEVKTILSNTSSIASIAYSTNVSVIATQNYDDAMA